jgi:hypothetical protein
MKIIYWSSALISMLFFQATVHYSLKETVSDENSGKKYLQILLPGIGSGYRNMQTGIFCMENDSTDKIVSGIGNCNFSYEPASRRSLAQVVDLGIRCFPVDLPKSIIAKYRNRGPKLFIFRLESD